MRRLHPPTTITSEKGNGIYEKATSISPATIITEKGNGINEKDPPVPLTITTEKGKDNGKDIKSKGAP